MFSNNKICKLFEIRYPVIQGGMVWCSGWELASAVSNAGGLGLVGAGSMSPEVLKKHIQKTRQHTEKPFGVNIPLLRREIDDHMKVIVDEGVKIVFTSAGNPKTWTDHLKGKGCTVVHVVSSAKFALKAQDAGVDAVVAEGFEAGGHNGREETTSFVLLPSVKKVIDIPLIAAGGMYGGDSLLAAMALGADGIQVGSRFAVAKESSAHEKFKELVMETIEGQTKLTLKKLAPARLILNAFAKRVLEAESEGATATQLVELLGRGRSKKGIFEGDLVEGELEIGQVSALLQKVESAEEIIHSIVEEYQELKQKLQS